MQVHQSTQDEINELERIRQVLLNQPNGTDDAVFHNNTRIARLAEMKTELDKLHCKKRHEYANRNQNQSNAR